MTFSWETFTYDEAWLREAVRLEEEAGVDIEIGCKTTPSRPIDPVQLRIELTKVRLFSALFQELRNLLIQADLGAGLEAALIKGRFVIQHRLRSLSPTQMTSFEALLEGKPHEEAPVSQSQVTSALSRLLTDLDWQEIADSATAALQTHLLEQVALRRSA
ncbi:MAG: hypothetical protein HC780_17515 [Leptolyngbyaceae cyanobacterium CSU_1_3]|nr:hypothetical protein [Leptolyngbyaceae cyanobacterium CSU_1_3]